VTSEVGAASSTMHGISYKNCHVLTKPGRLVRMIPPTHSNIYELLNHRLPKDTDAALADWQSLVSGRSALWRPINSSARELLRSMLNHLNMEILKRARPPHSTFNFASASVGNMFLTGARLLTGSFESAIYLLTLIGGVPDNTTVVPAINSNFSHHISASLATGAVITGQNAISHPSAPTAVPDLITSPTALFSSSSEEPHPEDANLPGSLPMLRQQNIHFSKSHEEDLPARIQRIWYINPYGQEIAPAANPKAASAIRGCEAVIYSIGSLYTSIVPCLVLRGVGEALAKNDNVRCKILILNGSIDRETGPSTQPFEASDFVAAIARAGEESQGRMGEASKETWKCYVTHVVYLEGEYAPKLFKSELSAAGIESVRCWGRKGEDGIMRFDGMGLTGALEAILGMREWRGPRSRRNTLEG
jgi:2-phospho-L-lactate transferase/gluconeogenesis factor (CofD/UPF0052 family)